MSKRGFTLIELIIGLSVLVITLPMTVGVFQQVLQTRVMAEFRITATSLAQMVLEHETQKRFSAVTSIAATPFNQGTAESNPYFDTDFAGFSYQVAVDCIWPADTSVSLDSNLNNWSVVAGCTGASADYKRITVTVQHPNTGTVQLVTIATNTTDPGICAGRTVSHWTDCDNVQEQFCQGGGITVCVPATGCTCPYLNNNGAK